MKETADALVSTGMRDAGYQYLVIDDCWQVSRDAQGRIVPDPQRFPSGMKALADYVHSKGLKFGVYSDAGTGTCQKRPGSKDHETVDARSYAEWGVDYLKYDWCNSEGQDPHDSYARMSRALRATGRPIVFSMCEWGTSHPWQWAQGIAHLWRSTGDIQDCWDCGKSWGGMGVVTSSTSRPTSIPTPVPATGTTPTCWRSATEASRPPSRAPTSASGRCSRRL
jgi:alpha-galactosidase